MVHTIADITPNGTATPLIAANVRTPAKWVAFAAAGTTIRIGDSNVGASRGLLLQTLVPFDFKPIGDTQYLDLSQVYVFGASGSDKVSITYGL